VSLQKRPQCARDRLQFLHSFRKRAVSQSWHAEEIALLMKNEPDHLIKDGVSP